MVDIIDYNFSTGNMLANHTYIISCNRASAMIVACPIHRKRVMSLNFYFLLFKLVITSVLEALMEEHRAWLLYKLVMAG